MYRKRRFRRRYKRRKRRRFFKPGYHRTIGFYGRFGRGGETKFFDSSVNISVAVAVWDASTANIMLTIPVGTSESERIGRKITVVGMYLRGDYDMGFVENNTTPYSGNTIRTIIYLDKQCNGVIASGTDIFRTNDIFSFRNLSNTKRFKILYDKQVSLSYNTLSQEAANLFSVCGVHRNIKINLSNLHIPIEYNRLVGTSGTIDERMSNNIGIMHCLHHAESDATGLPGITFTAKVRIRYTDN